MATRTAIFKAASEKDDENEKLVELFKNRAELKKEFAELRKEQHRLHQRIKEEQGATARATQKLEHLEGLLVDPEWSNTVVVFYQLRSLNRRCQGKIAKFAEQLKQQREKKLQVGELSQWKKKLEREAADIEKKIGEQRAVIQTIEDRLQAERDRVESMSGLAKVFKGRSASDELDVFTAELAAAQQSEQELLEELEAVRNRKPDGNAGLSIAEKRSINFMIISFAQQVYLQFQDDRLVSLIKEAADKSVGAINYGDKTDCDAVLDLVTRRASAIDEIKGTPDLLQRRAGLIAEHALFKDDDDAVPIPGTVATVFSIDEDGVIKEKDANLLGENFWGLSQVLSR